MKTITLKQFIGGFNFDLLKAQKIVLLELQGKLTENDSEWLAIEGMLNLIDQIQDIAVDKIGFAESHVFNLSDNDNHIGLEEANNILLESSLEKKSAPQTKSKLFDAIKADERLHSWACASIRHNSTREYQAIDFRAKVSHLFPDASLDEYEVALREIEEDLDAN